MTGLSGVGRLAVAAVVAVAGEAVAVVGKAEVEVGKAVVEAEKAGVANGIDLELVVAVVLAFQQGTLGNFS